jgi:integrase
LDSNVAAVQMLSKGALTMPTIKLNEKKATRLVNTSSTKHKIFWDQTLPGFGIRLRPEGARTYVAGGRFGAKHYRPLELGDARKMKFEAARAKAREWLAFDAEGLDPRTVELARATAEAAKKLEQERRNGHTLNAVVDEFIKSKVIGSNEKKPLQRKWKEVKRHVGILTAQWGPRPIHDITRPEAVTFIKAKKSTPAEARNLLGVAKQLFSWARDQEYGLEVNIFADIKPSSIIGKKVARDRTLTEAEVKALWRAVSKMPYPFGPAYQMLILTGLRLNECVQGRWSEIDLKARIWTIPASRMKGKNRTARAHVVPLTDKMVGILNALPRFAGDYVFTTTGGKKPISLGSKIKDRLDAELEFEEEWENHDLRRSINSSLVAIVDKDNRPAVKEEVVDAILAHKQPGVKGVYNRHKYVPERRAALELWGNHVDPPSNVTPLRARA